MFSEHGQPLSKNALKKLEKEKLKKERAEKDALARAAQAAAKASATVVRSSRFFDDSTLFDPLPCFCFFLCLSALFTNEVLSSRCL